MKKFIIISFLVFILGNKESFSQPGSIDSTFGLNGITTTTMLHEISNCRIQSAALQDDGKIIAAGLGDFGAGPYFIVSRYCHNGTPDNTFGLNGTVITRIGDECQSYSAVVQSDGKIVVGGRSLTGTTTNFALARYNSNGTLDDSFGTGGKVITSLGTTHAGIFSIALQSDGKIIAGGYCNEVTTDFALARYNSDGTLDNSFGASGIVITSAVSSEQIHSIALQPDGKIIAGGRTNFAGSFDFTVARYNINGTLDDTFGINGVVITVSGTSEDGVNSTVLQPDGKIIAAGYSDLGGSQDFTMVRYNVNGTLDNTFGLSGVVITVSGGSADYPHTAILQPDGKIVLAGLAIFGGGDEAVVLMRYNNNGELDNTFGTSGIVLTQIGSTAEGALAGVIQSDGKIVAAGYNYIIDHNRFALLRYNPNGTLDNSFIENGIKLHNIGLSDIETISSAVQGYGKIVLAGHIDNGSNDDFALTRYTKDGSIDTLFGTAGLVTTAIGSSDDRANCVAIQADGKIVAAGMSGDAGTFNFSLARYNADGQIDNTFAAVGSLITSIGTWSMASSVLIQDDAKIIAAGSAEAGGNNDFAIVRYSSEGVPDNTFGTDGIVTISIGTGDDWLNSVRLQSDGKIIAAGYSKTGSNMDFAVVRLNTDGTLDNTFGTNGIVITSVSTSNDAVQDLAIQNDGKIIAAGYAMNGGVMNFALVRYNIDGTVDNSFGTNGIVTTAVGITSSYIQSIAVQTNGKIIAAGSSDEAVTGTISLVRYNADGTIDETFGTDGFIKTSVGSAYTIAYSMLLQDNGKIVVTGCSYIDGDVFSCAVTLVRYMGDPPVDVKNVTPEIPSHFVLGQNYPNPFNPVTNILFSIPEAGFVSLKIFDLLGNEVGVIVNEEKSAGTYKAILNAGDLSTGVYFYRLQAGRFTDTKKFILLK